MDTYARVRGFLAETLGVEEEDIRPGSRLADLFNSRRIRATASEGGMERHLAGFIGELSVDSPGMVEFTMAFEEAFDVDVPDGSVEDADWWERFFGWVTVREFAEYIERGRLPD